MANNFVPLYLPLELLTVLNEESGKGKQMISSYCIRSLIEKHREQIVSKFGEDFYEQLIFDFSKDVVTQKSEKIEREKRKVAEREEKLALRKKALAIKEKELEIREGNREQRDQKREEQIAELLQQRDFWLERLANEPRVKDNAECHLKEIDQRLEALGYRTPEAQVTD